MTDFNPQDELARERNHLAADRSLLSFVRSSLTLIGIGVGIDQVVSAIAPAGHFIDIWAYGLSLLLLGLGVVALGLAIHDYQGEMQRLKAPVYRYTPRPALGSTTSLVVLVVGTLAFVWLGLKLWPGG
ncbi:MAG: YidH family protein [Nodosilinea sp.]